MLDLTESTSPSRSVRPLPWHWRCLEAAFHHFYRMEALADDPDCLLAYNLYTYRGPEVRLKCGTVIRSGDPVLELHFRREALAPLIQDGDPRRRGLGLLRLGDRDVPRLARALQERPELRSVKAAHALTLFHRGVSRWGFETMPVQERHLERWFTWWHRLLMARDHHRGGAHVQEFEEKLVTRHIWTSRAELTRRYGESSSKPRPGPAEAVLR